MTPLTLTSLGSVSDAANLQYTMCGPLISDPYGHPLGSVRVVLQGQQLLSAAEA
jgi:hypothetical protein